MHLRGRFFLRGDNFRAGGLGRMERVAVVGVGQVPFKRAHREKTYYALAFEATQRALASSGLSPRDLDAVVYSIYFELMIRQGMPDIFINDYLGLQGIKGLKVAAGAASGGHAIHAAYMQIAAGMSDTVLVVGVQKVSDLCDLETGSRADGLAMLLPIMSDVTWERPLLPGGLMPMLNAVCLVPHMERYGGPTAEQMAKVAVKNHRNALTNPNAEVNTGADAGQELTVEDVLNAGMAVWPTTEPECCLYGDGAAAIVLAGERRARELSDRPVWLEAMSVADYSLHQVEPSKLGRLWGVAEAARRAYKAAGIKDPLKELDVVEVHDINSGIEVMTYEELGLCELGEGGRLVDEGIVEKGGALPVNPSGGRVACGHVPGVSDISSACDVVLQLQERAGGIQVPIRKGRGLVESVCEAGSFSTVMIFAREG